jgi:AP-1 complex subunit beta-1
VPGRPLLRAPAVLPGEIHELREELASLDRPKKKEAVKKVIAAMTVGKDVSMLFPHVVNCMQTEDLELKKLVYLYLINYAKTQPDLAIMAVNTFVKVGQRARLPRCQQQTHPRSAR